MNTSRLKVQPDISILFGYFWIIILACYWCGLLVSPQKYISQAGIAVLIIAIGSSLAVSGWAWGRSMADGARVLGAMQAPNELWREWLRRVLTAICVQWGLAVLAGTIATTLKQSTWPWSFVIALYSIVLALSVVGSLSYFGVWHWAWQWCIALGVSILITISVWLKLDQLLLMSTIWHMAIALSWPFLAIRLAWCWRKSPPHGVATRRRVQFNLWHLYVSYARRYTVLNSAVTREAQSQNGPVMRAFATSVPMIYLMGLRSFALNGQWGNQTSLLYVGALGILAIFASATVICKDLHWRRVLAPNGFPRGRLGWHIISSTLTACIPIAIMIAGTFGMILIICSWAGVGVSSARYLEIVARYRVLPIEFVLMVCVGVAVRGARRPALTIFIALFAFCAIGILSFLIFKAKVLSGFFVIGPIYVGCLLLAICAAIMLANRVWTTQRLLPYIIADASNNDNSIEGARWFFWPGQPY